MARPQKSSRELIASGARCRRINARLAQEARARGLTDAVKAYLESWKSEIATFENRKVPGQVVMRELSGAMWEWYPATITPAKNW
jgi:hypothetical protein